MAAAFFSLFTLFVFNLICQRASRQGGSTLLLQPSNPGGMFQDLPAKSPIPVASTLQKTFSLSKNGFQISISHSIHDVDVTWEQAAPGENLFLQRPYLTAVEENPPKGMRFSYLIFLKNEQPVGIAYCQISPFNVDNSIQAGSGEKDKYPCVLRAFGRFLKNLLVGKNHNLLVCGNLLLTGEHGFYFKNGLDKAIAFDLVEEALLLAQDEWEKLKVNIDGIFIKDVAPDHRATGKVLMDRKFREFTFHPNMVLDLPEGWESLDDYLATISSKYRVRAKRAFRLAENIEKRELTENQIFSNQSRLYELYVNVMDNQDFNMVTLNERYLPSLKQHLGDRFRIFGYYLDGEMMGYYTTILNGEELEAHFLGFEQTCNRECQVYLNMLFDLLRFGIEQGVRRVVYARTAMEIKSSVGAEPIDMFCYIRANNRLTNKILPPILEYLRPPDDSVPRSPFKGKDG